MYHLHHHHDRTYNSSYSHACMMKIRCIHTIYICIIGHPSSCWSSAKRHNTTTKQQYQEYDGWSFEFWAKHNRQHHPFFLFPLTEKHRHGPPTATRKGKRNDDHSRCAMSELHTSWNVKTTCSSKSEMCYSPHSITISNTTSSPLLRHSRISVGTTPSLTVNVRRKASVAQQCGGYLWWHDSIVNLVSCKSTTSWLHWCTNNWWSHWRDIYSLVK